VFLGETWSYIHVFTSGNNRQKTVQEKRVKTLERGKDQVTSEPFCDEEGSSNGSAARYFRSMWIDVFVR